jgi:hypothetical protein
MAVMPFGPVTFDTRVTSGVGKGSDPLAAQHIIAVIRRSWAMASLVLLRPLGSNTTAVWAAAHRTAAGSSSVLSSVCFRSFSDSSSSTTDVVDVSKLKRSKVPPAPSLRDPEDEAKESPVQRYLAKLRKIDLHAVGGTLADLPDPVLPENPAEIAFLAPAQARAGHLKYLPNGERRVVLITQHPWCPTQSAKYDEKYWHIQFDFENESALGWENELMGWRSGSDPLDATNQMVFHNAQEAIYLCEKNGWEYIVNQPIRRKVRSDGAQYQDNFLPQRIAYRVQQEGKRCDQWKRAKSGSSHYVRPLKYHGDGTVQQYGRNPNEPMAPFVQGLFKIR